MTRTFIKLHGAWSGKPCYLDADGIISAGKAPEDLTQTLVVFEPGYSAVVAESPDEIARLLLAGTDIDIIEDFNYDTKRAAALAAIAERAAKKESKY